MKEEEEDGANRKSRKEDYRFSVRSLRQISDMSLFRNHKRKLVLFLKSLRIHYVDSHFSFAVNNITFMQRCSPLSSRLTAKDNNITIIQLYIYISRFID